MNLFAISINHHTAPVELREALHLNEEEIKKFILKLKNDRIQEGFILSTCNRTEIYAIPADNQLNHAALQNFILKEKPVERITPHHFTNFNSYEAIRHLFYVISGIDSLLIGDNQIYHQVKDSFKLADELEFTGFLMRRIFSAAVKAGKRALSETEISEGAVTVSYAAVQLIEKIFSHLSKKAALVIGAGETGEIAAKHLIEKNIGRLAITNRTAERAGKLAEKLNAGVLPFSEFKNYLHEYDIIISATSSENFILTAEDIKSAMKKRNSADLVIMDIAIPRDIDPASKKIDYVFYHDIDSLNIIVEKNLAKRRDEIPKVEKIIDEELNSFIKWYSSLEVAPTIKTLRDYFELIRSDEVEKNKNKFSADDQEKLDIVTKRIINKILHLPTVELKKMTEAGNNADETAMKISIIRDLFGIDKKDQEETSK
jgi:glutamyl-tRNA reductase